MQRPTVDDFKKQNEEREEEAGGERKPKRGADSDTTDDESTAGRERLTEQVKKNMYYSQPQWLKQYPWLQYEGNAMLCEYCRQCARPLHATSNYLLPEVQGMKECCC